MTAALAPFQPWTQQPNGIVLPSPDWASRGLVALFDQRVGRELFTGLSASANTAAAGRGPLGVGRNYSGTANTQYPHHPRFAITGPISIVAVLDVNALTNYGAIIAKQATTTTYTPYEMRVGFTANAGSFMFGRAPSSGPAAQGSTSDNSYIPAGFSGTLVYTLNNNEAGYYRSKVAGVARAYRTAFSATAADNGSSSVWIGRRYDGATQLDGRIYFVALFNRGLTEGEARALTDNPWQLFAAPERQPRVFLPVSARPGVPRLIDPTATNVLASSVQPRVTLDIE